MSDKFGSYVSSNERHTLETNPRLTVSYRPTKKLKYLMHHVAKMQFIDDIKFHENKKIIDPNSHFQFV
ncbi:hypothetical protein H257_04295 [Aphanomyces astaci]|uniref:Uncharacterized protein n=1 Tax=Aphanomyces astaci TaxID=112090 RepID=W4GXH8_APHAT|nr:hypothetical protein H257_04295 [Aphanomyces astaci]ETV83598.1 hypothetical protein H257_04295 [Aphanomyces astaci]|eukprot:XP_009827028.1 hypothetical protein H257_04295 [Aphanomyces astaci]